MYYKTVNGKRYGPYQSPPRERHEWTAKDLARLARYLKNKRGISGTEILVLVASAVGFGTIFCKTAKALTAALSLSSFIKQLGAVLALSTFIKVLIEFLLAAKLVSPRWLNIILALLVATLVFIDKLFESLSESLSNLDTINEVSAQIYELCDKANELAGIAKDEACSVVSANACYIAERKAEQIAELLKPDLERAINQFDKSLMEQFWQIIKDNWHDGDFGNWWN